MQHEPQHLGALDEVEPEVEAKQQALEQPLSAEENTKDTKDTKDTKRTKDFREM